jgi:hypothetical protein
MMKFLVTLFLLVFLPEAVAAHGLVTTQTQKVGSYVAEFEYNTVGNITAGDLTIFDVYLLDQNQNPVDFDRVTIRISDKVKQRTYLASTLAESADVKGTAILAGVIKDPGDYMADVDFSKSGTDIGPLTFNFKVDSIPNLVTTTGVKAKNPTTILLYIFIFALGLGIGVAVSRRKQ